MATAKQKITLNASRDIPFNKLMLSQSNVRRIKRGETIEDLAASIGRRGLLQSLNVRPVLDGEGNETGMFEVPAGGRRYRALELLVKQKRMAKTEPVPCVVTDANSVVPIEEDSLAENFQREDLHPLDMFRAFQTLVDQGASHEEIGARFFVSATFVQQRLRLAKVSPRLHDVYEQDGMTLEQLMAFTVTEDHARQGQVWEALGNSWSKEPQQIRRMLTETTVRAGDRRALFVGIDAYVAADGVVLRDLFEADNGGWLQDPALLDRLVGDKLKAAADDIAAEGWKWIVVDIDLPYGHTHGLRALAGTPADLSEDERAEREALRAEYDRLETEYGEADELPDAVDQRLGEIETALEAFESRPMSYDPAEIARAGAFLSIDRDGDLVIDRGYVRPEDEAPEVVEGDGAEADGETGSDDADGEPAVRRTTITIGAQPTDTEEDEGDGIKPLPERLVIELTAHRTLALRNAVGENPHVAITALLHRLVLDTFGQRSATGCIEASVRHVHLPVQDAGLKDSPAAKAVDARHEAWKSDIPLGDDAALWLWLDDLDDASRQALLAHCISYGVNALFERPNPYGSGISQHGLDQRLREADRLSHATGLDMVDAGWRPTVDNYLGRVTKARILEAVREGAGEQAAQLIDHLKKGDMAKEGERLLADSGWLPEPLRLIGDDAAADQPVEEDAALPEFLAGDDADSPAASDDETAHAVAAE
ncbi:MULTISPECIES: ParB/RepB/Spo0J family partition protein [unclassified Devosia]|uniref:ParB/RepB/Spo0J family partition protein n=1 Tax=unclassified Devosia TaxID=196773 RepID=UPI000869A02B|nr:MULTISPECIES: ParB/RepB/Spo0J family partition protein [unclassified Devosia]MBN9362824.1 ParB N-terminal domain-containing protein [Devosia sp.]ODS88378.1 MAG: DNA-binding protein [Devosia sp. SCN 66-27]OJX23995.1 MAG: DNA-binding protein [Devosia sp. 66-14]